MFSLLIVRYLLISILSFVLGSPGGVLFDYYVLLFGSRRDIKLLTTHLTSEQKENDDFDVNAMFKGYASCFWFFAAQSLYAANQKCKAFAPCYASVLVPRALKSRASTWILVRNLPCVSQSRHQKGGAHPQLCFES